MPSHVGTAVADADLAPEPALLRREEPLLNMRRFYGLALARSLWGEWGVVRRWGRLGAQGRICTDWHATREEAEAGLARTTAAKRRRGYG